MASAVDDSSELPKLRLFFNLPDLAGLRDGLRQASNENPKNQPRQPKMNVKVDEFFDVKFCQFQPVNADQIFAAISLNSIVVCRVIKGVPEEDAFEVLRVVQDVEEDAGNCCCTWARAATNGPALLCVSGVGAKVKVYDPVLGETVAALIGHGGDINDMATSPANPCVIATASDDATIRLWSLEKTHTSQPCLLCLGGEVHGWDLLSVAFHNTGRFLLSAGHDQVISLWAVPDLSTEPIDVPIRRHSPHFSSSEIHTGVIDCVAFFHDLILSRACHENVIVLWKVEGFSSKKKAPSDTIGSSSHDSTRLTRSTFTPTPSSVGAAHYTRLLEFSTPGCDIMFFMRFRLHLVPNQHPILAFCTAGGKVLFWDLNRLGVYQRLVQAAHASNGSQNGTQVARPDWLRRDRPRARGDGQGGAGSAGRSGGPTVTTSVTASQTANRLPDDLATWRQKYDARDPYGPVRAHREESVSSTSSIGRQVAWSPCGAWCVVVGSSNLALVLQRWVD